MNAQVKVNAEVRKLVLQALTEFAGEPVSAYEYQLDVIARTSNDSWLIRARSGTDDFALRVIRPEDRPRQRRVWTGEFAGNHVVEQSSIRLGHVDVVKRDYLDRVFTARDLIRESRGLNYARKESQRFVRTFLDQALLGIQSVHDAGRVHGDIRPEKFGYHGDDLFLRDVGVRFSHSPKPGRYVAPELRADGGDPYTPAADIFAFLKVAGDLLKPYRGYTETPDLARLDAQVRWLQDYYFPRADRPSARELRLFLLDQRVPDAPHRRDRILVGVNERSSLFGRKARKARLMELQESLTKYPETMFAIDSSSGEQIGRWLEVTSRPRRRRSRIHALGEFNTDDLPDTIDDRWVNGLHRLMFGFPMDADHQARMEHLDPERAAERALFLAAIETANRARDQLLHESRFISTREAISVLDGHGRNLGRDDFMILRRWGYILAVPDHGRWLYPDFQFAPGSFSPLIHRVHSALRKHRRGEDADPWVELSFWSTRREALGGAALKDVLWKDSMRNRIESVLAQAEI